ncbi:alpha/beta hydrolase-fold protein [Aliikangiella coralliicola]|uniref:Uncharacterized protein n=1 Tax=Aliikangiella coralliicola TaxID=2592383 RepID=A0A545UJ25_9GAMM|nr:alpha/beta hydrolase-fold protein [Aliikangiella coralliicola]TQV89433.1 hypothetical protein FLL46_00695 [Aliikangiella coralliicola]
MKVVRYLLLFAVHLALYAVTLNSVAEPISIEIGKRTTINSKLLKEERKLLIHLPESYADSKKSYPVVYLLDGNRHFNHAITATKILQQEGRIPEVIVVGITNNRGTRGRDLNREKDQFAKFIQQEVVTYIDKNYRTTGLNTLFGHSLAGYFTINFLVNQPEIFKNYIAASPVLQVDNTETRSQYLETYKTQQAKENSLYFTMTSEAEEGRATIEALNHFVELLKDKSPEELDWHYEFIANQIHMTTPYLTFYAGLTHVFKTYQAPSFSSFSDFKKSGGMIALKSHYKKRAKIYGTDAKIPETTLIDLADILLDDGQTEKALKIYVDLTKAYPKSARAFSGLGEVYKAMKLYDKSIKVHEEAVRLSAKLSPGWQRFLKSRLEDVKNTDR